MLRVLLVDDQIDYLESVDDLLKFDGYQTLPVSDSSSVLDLLGDFRPDIIVVDYKLNDGRDGFELAMMLREKLGDDIPTIVITAARSNELNRKIAETAEMKLLFKPFHIKDLIDAFE